MSGSVRGDVGPPRTPETPKCLKIYKGLPIYSTDTEVLQKVKVGDRLKFKIDRSNGNRSLHVLYEGEVLGSVIELQLTDCIEQGHEYIAVIVSIEGMLCFVDAEMKE